MKNKIILLTQINSKESLDVYKAISQSKLIDQVDVLFHLPNPSLKSKFRSQLRNFKHHGPVWLPYRLYVALRNIFSTPRTDHSNTESLLNFIENQERSKVHFVSILNSKKTREILQTNNYNLGVVFGAGILKESVFSIPEKGMINIHQGLIPRYRGMPPAFWELYNSESKTGISIHQVATKLDMGSVYFQESIDIEGSDTEVSLQRKLNQSTVNHILATTESVLQNKQQTIEFSEKPCPSYTRPTVFERLRLARKGKCIW